MRRKPGKKCFCPFFAKTAHQKLRGGESIQSQARQQQRVSREAGHGAENFRSQLSPLLSEGSHECAPGVAIALERRFSITEVAFQHHRRSVVQRMRQRRSRMLYRSSESAPHFCVHITVGAKPSATR